MLVLDPLIDQLLVHRMVEINLQPNVLNRCRKLEFRISDEWLELVFSGCKGGIRLSAKCRESIA
jgi:hypothetical protein